MGLFGDVRKLSKQAKELQKDYDPAAQMRSARSQLQAMTAQTELAGSATAVRSPATVVEVRDTGTMVNMQPVFDCDVTIRPVGGVPFAATMQLMGAAHLATVRVGGEVTVMHEPGDATRVALA